MSNGVEEPAGITSQNLCKRLEYMAYIPFKSIKWLANYYRELELMGRSQSGGDKDFSIMDHTLFRDSRSYTGQETYPFWSLVTSCTRNSSLKTLSKIVGVIIRIYILGFACSL